MVYIKIRNDFGFSNIRNPLRIKAEKRINSALGFGGSVTLGL